MASTSMSVVPCHACMTFVAKGSRGPRLHCSVNARRLALTTLAQKKASLKLPPHSAE